MIRLTTGVPRSGTSAWMELCEAGGLPVAKSKSRDDFNDANSDEFYKPNHKGLYELSGAELGTMDWPQRYDGHAVKVMATNLAVLRPYGPWWCRWWSKRVFPKLRRRALLASGKYYSAVVMLRDPEEIRQSGEGGFGLESTVERIVQWQVWAQEILERRPDVVDIKKVWYADLVADPVSVISSVGWPLDVAKAAAVVRPELYRVRVEYIVEGI